MSFREQMQYCCGLSSQTAKRRAHVHNHVSMSSAAETKARRAVGWVSTRQVDRATLLVLLYIPHATRARMRRGTRRKLDILHTAHDPHHGYFGAGAKRKR